MIVEDEAVISLRLKQTLTAMGYDDVVIKGEVETEKGMRHQKIGNLSIRHLSEVFP